MVVDLETAIQQFLDAARELVSHHALTADAALQRLFEMYRVRIEGAPLDDDGDMLLLQWGRQTPLLLDEPTDLRQVTDEALVFDKSANQYLDITRQVFAAGEQEDADFDEQAIQMSMTLVYGLASGDESSSHQWIRRPSELDDAIERFQRVRLVQQLLPLPPSRLVATVCYCG